MVITNNDCVDLQWKSKWRRKKYKMCSLERRRALGSQCCGQDVGNAELRHTRRGELRTGGRVLLETKLEGWSPLSPRHQTQTYRIQHFPHWVSISLWSSLSSLCPYSSILEWECRFCVITLIVYKLYFDFIEGPHLRDCLEFQRTLNFWIVLKLLKTMGTFEIGLNVFYIMRCKWIQGSKWVSLNEKGPP